MPHYFSAEEPVALLFGNVIGTQNIVSIGGGTGLLNAATRLLFYTAATPNTTTGTPRMSIEPSGHVGIGTTSPGATLHVVGNVIVDGNISAKYQDLAEWVPSPTPWRQPPWSSSIPNRRIT